MKMKKMKVVALLLSLCLVAMLTLVGCGGDENGGGGGGGNNTGGGATNNTNNIDGGGANTGGAQDQSGDIIVQVGVPCSTKWFDFTVNSIQTSPSYDSISAAAGNTLVIANVTITNTFGSTQPFGTFDWLVDDDTLAQYIWPLDPVNGNMMPADFDLNDGQTATYDVVVEVPDNLPNPFFVYFEIDASGNIGAAFKLPIK